MSEQQPASRIADDAKAMTVKVELTPAERKIRWALYFLFAFALIFFLLDIFDHWSRLHEVFDVWSQTRPRLPDSVSPQKFVGHLQVLACLNGYFFQKSLTRVAFWQQCGC
jgi:hypothetical protein